MIQAIHAILFSSYVAATCGLLVHTLCFFYLLFLFRRRKRDPSRPPAFYPEDRLPLQLVQLPVYNEDPGMVGALVDSACALQYRRDRLAIQVLDDSDRDDISRKIGDHVALRKEADPDLRIAHLRRSSRTDYKAGNLRRGLEIARKKLGEEILSDPDNVIVSIFDADFLIPEDYLRDTVHYFKAPEVGAVQASVRYLNADDGVLTRTQSAYLTNLHRIDFASRSHSGHFSTFLGSAGSWRLSAIESSGGWTSDTQIEDVDLSIAAQLSGWKIVYLDHISVWSRLPDSYGGFKLQQRSWMKGMMEVWRKHARGILNESGRTFFRKAMTLELFLVLPLQPPFMIAHHLLALPAYRFLSRLGVAEWMGCLATALAVLLNVSHLPFVRSPLAARATGESPGPAAARPLWEPAASICIMLGMFVTFSYGLVEGLFGGRVHRDSTQKGIPDGNAAAAVPSAFQRSILGRIAVVELVLVAYSLFFTLWALRNGEWGLLLLYGPFSLGYPWIAMHTAGESGFRHIGADERRIP